MARRANAAASNRTSPNNQFVVERTKEEIPAICGGTSILGAGLPSCCHRFTTTQAAFRQHGGWPWTL